MLNHIKDEAIVEVWPLCTNAIGANLPASTIHDVERVIYTTDGECINDPGKEVEEDEEIISVLNAYAEVAENDDCPLNAERIRKAVVKLKSLNPQSQWKPSDEQLDSLYDVLNPCDGFNREVLESLYVQLKKLREE